MYLNLCLINYKTIISTLNAIIKIRSFSKEHFDTKYIVKYKCFSTIVYITLESAQ